MAVPWNTKAEWPELKKVATNTKVSYDLFNRIIYAMLHLKSREVKK